MRSVAIPLDDRVGEITLLEFDGRTLPVTGLVGGAVGAVPLVQREIEPLLLLAIGDVAVDHDAVVPEHVLADDDSLRPAARYVEEDPLVVLAAEQARGGVPLGGAPVDVSGDIVHVLDRGHRVVDPERLDEIAAVVLDVSHLPVGVAGAPAAVAVKAQRHVAADLLEVGRHPLEPLESPFQTELRMPPHSGLQTGRPHGGVGDPVLTVIGRHHGVALEEGGRETAVGILLLEAQRDELQRAGGVAAVGQAVGVLALRTALPLPVLGVPEDAEARAGERLVGARDHALDHGGGHDEVVAVHRKVDEMTILRAFGIDGLLAEHQWRSHDHLQIDRTGQFLGLQVVVPRGLAGGEEILR